MEYAELVAVYRRLEATASTNGKTAVLARAFADAGALLPEIVTLVRGRVFAAWRDRDLGVSSSLTTAAVARATGVDPDRIEAEWRETGDLGSAAEWAVRNRRQRSLVSEPLTVGRVVGTLRDLPDYEGDGSRERRVDAVAGLVADADPLEARYVVRTALGHLRVGVGDGIVRDAIAEAFLADGPLEAAPDPPGTDGDAAPIELRADDAAVAAVERARQVTNDVPLVAETARDGGRAALSELDVRLGRPVASMLAETTESLDAGIEGIAAEPGDVLAEYKYDGARIQAHVDGGEVRLFTRRLEEVTAGFPELVDPLEEAVTADAAILDGEAVGRNPETGAPVAFQEFSRRIRREHDVDELAAEIPATLYLFDALYVDGETLLEAPLRDRRARLRAAFDPVPDRVEPATGAPHDGRDPEAVYRAALAAGHEGVMLKNLAAPYEPGRRVGRMAKVKPTMEPLDLVVVRAQWSEGRRSDFLGRLHLACFDADADIDADADTGGDRDDRLREVGRLSTGYTDEELRELTDRLEALIVDRDGRTVDLRPEVVLEVEYEAIQSSPEYDSGFALRFPRFLAVRDDLAPEEADTVDRVRTLYETQQ